MPKDTKENVRQQYKVYCIMNNLTECEQGFKCYLSDQMMLKRIRQSKQSQKRQ